MEIRLILNRTCLIRGICAAAVILSGICRAEDSKDAWWHPAWTQRSKITLDTGTDAADLSETAGKASVLVRLHDGIFKFTSAREDGSDIRFIAADGKTLLPHQVEKYDALLNEAYVWVKLPEVKSATKEVFYIYYGNADAEMPVPTKPSEAFDDDFSLVYHFAEVAVAPVDSSTHANHATTVASSSESSRVGSGLRLLGGLPIQVPATPSLAWQLGQSLTLALWIKPTTRQEDTVIFSRTEGKNSLVLRLIQGIPVLEVANGAAPARTPSGAPIAEAAWAHLALVADGKTFRVLVNGEPYATLDGSLPALNSPLFIGGASEESTVTGNSAFVGEIDEFTLSKTARSAAWVKLVSVNQSGSDTSQRTLAIGAIEGGDSSEKSGLMEHLSLFGDIAGNMMFDGWIAIGVCGIMIIIGWTVAIRKFIYLNSIEKGTELFLKRWKVLSTDLTALDTEDNSSVHSLGGQVGVSDQALIQKSPLFHIYQIGSEEIRHRLDKDNNRVQGLSGRSIQAIRASLDAGLVHETHRLSDGLVYLTMSIAGGPYVGLLGTVVGVMITFAIIAKSGEVNVNSIAPGIASALLATVVGLVVAIPALFIYSYLNGRIKNSLGLMHVFIDEFVAKMAEFYRPAHEPDPSTTPR
jgi:biopolymer transport protein ExbB